MISVIMSTHNRSRDLGRSIESILQQTYTNFEFIICDDCSNDNTLDVIQKYANQDRRIVIIKNKINLGLQKSLNKCLSISKGDFVARMDDDDYSKKDRFKIEISYLKEHPNIAFVGSNVEFYSNDKGVYGGKNYPKLPSKYDLLKECQFVHPSILIRSNIIKKVNGYSESKKYYRVEDYELWLRLYSLGYKGANIQNNLVVYTKDYDSIKNIKKIDRINCIRLLYYYFKKFNFKKKYIFYVLFPFLKMLVPGFIRRIINNIKYSKY